MNELLRHRAMHALGLSGLQCERPISADPAVRNTDEGRAVQAGGEPSGSVSQRTPGTLTEHFDESAIGRASAIQELDNLIDIYGVETVLGRWGRNIAAIHGYLVTVEPKPSPGTITDPRR